MTPHDDTRDRVIRTETKVDALNESVHAMREDIAELVALANKARGGWWVAGVTGLISGLIGSVTALKAHLVALIH